MAAPLSNKRLQPLALTSPKKRRRVLSKNHGPSVDVINNLAKAIFEHAERRLTFYFSLCRAEERVATHLDRSPTKVNVWPTGARVQLGRGNNKEDMSHSIIRSTEDNLLENYAEQIFRDKHVTPVKEVALSRILTKENLEALKKSPTNKPLVERVLNKRAYLEKTSIEISTSACIKLPKDLNRKVDKRAEDKICTHAAKWRSEVMMGLKTPRQATDRLIQELQAHLMNEITSFDQEIENLDPVIDTAAIKDLETLRFYTQTELNGTNPISDEKPTLF